MRRTQAGYTFFGFLFITGVFVTTVVLAWAEADRSNQLLRKSDYLRWQMESLTRAVENHYLTTCEVRSLSQETDLVGKYIGRKYSSELGEFSLAVINESGLLQSSVSINVSAQNRALLNSAIANGAVLNGDTLTMKKRILRAKNQYQQVSLQSASLFAPPTC